MRAETRKSLYIFLSALLGMLIFVVLHRLVFFVYLMLLNIDATSFGFGMSSLELLAWDYFTLLLATLLGLWYGIWVGQHWYEMVYEQKTHGGFLKYFGELMWHTPRRPTQLAHDISSVAEKVETQMWQLEDLAEEIPQSLAPAEAVSAGKKPVRRRTTKKKAIQL